MFFQSISFKIEILSIQVGTLDTQIIIFKVNLDVTDDETVLQLSQVIHSSQ